MFNLHVTLRFLGMVDKNQQACIEQQLDKVPPVKVSLVFDRLRLHKRAQILWVEPETSPEGLYNMVSEIDEALSACTPEPRDHEFRPHITLLRNFRSAIESRINEPIECLFNGFCLVRSTVNNRGSTYEVLRRWIVKEV